MRLACIFLKTTNLYSRTPRNGENAAFSGWLAQCLVALVYDFFNNMNASEVSLHPLVLAATFLHCIKGNFSAPQVLLGKVLSC